MYCYKNYSAFGQRDWRLILVPAYNVYPDIVEVLEGMKVKFYCGSSSPAIWSYTPLNWSTTWNAGARLPNWMVTSEGDLVTLTCGSIKPVEWFNAHFYSQNKHWDSQFANVGLT